MAIVRLRLNPGYERALLRSPEMLAAVGKAADTIAAEVKRAAPRRAGLADDRQRHYADMIDGQAWIDTDGVRGTVNARHFTSLLIEYGTVHSPPHAPLRRALDAMRGRVL
jgi:hypothetical protein